MLLSLLLLLCFVVLLLTFCVSCGVIVCCVFLFFSCHGLDGERERERMRPWWHYVVGVFLAGAHDVEC